jgi:hypothetical protein
LGKSLLAQVKAGDGGALPRKLQGDRATVARTRACHGGDLSFEPIAIGHVFASSMCRHFRLRRLCDQSD